MKEERKVTCTASFNACFPSFYAFGLLILLNGTSLHAQGGKVFLDWHWKFWNEIQKPEYKELEKLLLVAPVSIARQAGKPPSLNLIQVSGLPVGGFDLLGRNLGGRRASFGIKVLNAGSMRR